MLPRLRKQPEKKSCHGQKWIDEYSWMHQDNCLEILRDPRKLTPEVRNYLEEEKILKLGHHFQKETDHHLKKPSLEEFA